MTKKISAITLILMVWISMTGFLPSTGTGLAAASFKAETLTFSKIAPVNGDISQPTIGVVLQWESVGDSNTTYQYCMWPREKKTCPTSKWVQVGKNTSVTLGTLQPSTVYYWTVRAKLSSGSYVYANGGTWWSFWTVFSAPTAFGKVYPANVATGLPLSLTLSWSQSQGIKVHYEYCYSTSLVDNACSGTWYRTNATSAAIYGLQYATTYYWQVRAVNVSGTTYADSGVTYQFTTLGAPPLYFSKLDPTNGATAEPINVTLQWSPSAGASSYAYCFDTTDDDACTTSWQSASTNTSAVVSLDYGTTYFWQVKAINTFGETLANNGAWSSFSTIVALPLGFNKVTPADSVADQSRTPTLYWWSQPGTDTYSYCINLTKDCTEWTPIAQNVAIQVPEATPLDYGTTYYWQVKATNTAGDTYADDGDWWSFTTLQNPPTADSPQSFTTAEDTLLSSALEANSEYTNLTYEIVGGKPAGDLELNDDGSFTYMPPLDFNGDVSFQFVVFDGFNPPAGPFTANITVTPVNDPPVLDPIPDQVVNQGDLLVFLVSAEDPDAPYGEVLSYELTAPDPLPTGAMLNPSNGIFGWDVPMNQKTGVYTFTVQVTDSGDPQLSDTTTVKIIVNAAIPVTGGTTIYIPLIKR